MASARTDTHPDTHPDTHYDLIVIGSGQGGGPLALAFARAGKRAALLERAHVGGTCVNTGCTPTKTMIASARVAHLARRAADYGVRAGDVSVDLGAVRARKDAVVASFRSGSERRLEGQENLDLIRGEASFVGEKRLEVGGRQLSAEVVVINVGQRPSLPPVEGLEGVPYLDSASVMELDSVPEHLLILGGGYIGLEFAQMFRRFGSEVTLVQRGPQLLPREDPDVAEAVADILREDGITVLLESSAARVSGGGAGVVLELASGELVRGSHLLVATGRTPNSDTLALGAAGVETDERGYVQVDEQLRTSAPGIYAIGDVTGGPAFTHISYDDYRILRANLLDGEARSTRGRNVPYTVFIDPQLGRVGLSEREAAAQGRRVRVAKLPMTRVARAIEAGETRGFMKALVDAETERIVGAAVLGPEGGEVVSVLQVAMMGGLPYTALRDAAISHPTLSESLNNLFMTLE